MNKYQQIGIRIATATNVGVLVAVIALAVAWRHAGRMHGVRPEQWATRQAISDIDGLIQIYRGTTRTLPRSLEELRRLDADWIRFRWDENGRPLDGWGRPFLYSVDGTKYAITSFGRDGQPGGIGWDCDLSNIDGWPREAAPTFRQFLVHPVTRGIIFTCLACGVLSFVLSFITVNPSGLQSQGALALMVKLGVTIVGALFAADMMSALHIPNYH